MIKKQAILFLTALFICSSNTYAKLEDSSAAFGALKATIEGIKAYAYTANKEELKRSNPEPSTLSTAIREALEVCCDYAVNLALETMLGNTLCHGKGNRDLDNYIDSHKCAAIVISETAKLMAGSSKFSTKKLLINVLKKLLERDLAINRRYPNATLAARSIGIAAGFLTSRFYNDLEAGTVNWTEFKKNTNNRYLSLQGGIESFSIAYAARNLPEYVEAFITGKDTEKRHTKHHAKFISDFLMVAGRPAIIWIINHIKNTSIQIAKETTQQNTQETT